MVKDFNPTEDILQDFIDGRLDAATARKVNAYMEQNPDAAVEIEKLRMVSQSLQNLGRSILDEPIPDRLKSVLERTRTQIGKERGNRGK